MNKKGPTPLAYASLDGGRVYLTFDDGPDARWTPRVLSILAAHNILATFFIVGRAARQDAGIVRQVANAGHEVGNHSWSHRHPWTMPPSIARREVRDGAAAIADLMGREPKYFRPPHGRLRRCMMEEAEDAGQQVVLWSLSAVDWGPLGYASAIATRLRKVRRGDVVLMHDGGRGVNRPEELIQVLPGFLETLVQRRLVPSALSASQ